MDPVTEAKARYAAAREPAPKPKPDPQALFHHAVRREARFAGLYALASMARARWALDFALARLAAGGPLSTRLEFVRPPEAA